MAAPAQLRRALQAAAALAALLLAACCGACAESPDPCSGRRLFVYELPARFNKDVVLEDCSRNSIRCQQLMNNGLGHVIDPPEGGVFQGLGKWSSSYQYSLEVVYHHRSLHYACRTLDTSQADAFLIPFYAGLEVALHGYKCTSGEKDRLSLELIDWLEKQPSWRRNEGRDHIMVFGRVTWDFRRRDHLGELWGSKLMWLPQMTNVVKIQAEKHPYNEDGVAVAIPCPSDFHPVYKWHVDTWVEKVKAAERHKLITFIGGLRPEDPSALSSHNRLRSVIIQQCIDSSECQLVNCLSKFMTEDRKCHDPFFKLERYMDSVFSLHPKGDSWTRKSVFDALLAGSIPVFFRPETAYMQYHWHLPEEGSTYSVYIDEQDIEAGVSIEEVLRRYTPDQIKGMQDTIARLTPDLVYADIDTDSRTDAVGFRDAFDITIDRALRNITESASLRK
eukprot:SM000160S02530  [mRNA]  locus=s160:62130:65379:- [translate_table: standard]